MNKDVYNIEESFQKFVDLDRAPGDFQALLILFLSQLIACISCIIFTKILLVVFYVKLLIDRQTNKLGVKHKLFGGGKVFI